MRQAHTKMPLTRLVISACSLLFFFSCQAYSRPEILNAGDIAPNWMLRDTNGDPVLLYEEVDKTAVTVMFFWATWCQKCSELLPELQSLANTTTPQNAAFYTLNIWEDKDPAEHLESLGVTLPLLTKAESVAQRYGVGGTPSLIVIGPNREILLSQQAGEINNIKEEINALLTTSTHTTN